MAAFAHLLSGGSNPVPAPELAEVGGEIQFKAKQSIN